MERIIAKIHGQIDSNKFSGEVYDHETNLTRLAYANKIYVIEILNPIEFNNSDLLLISIEKVDGDKISGYAEIFKRPDQNEIIFYKSI